ncbi:MAG TPA: ABC transporter permease, partial [Solirubrobacter sp.]|nr:ABC transporter permease [Solirubrobacter sp.]
LVLAVVFVTVYTGVTLNRDLATGAFDRFRSLPVWRPAPIVGALIGDSGRYLLAASLVIALGFIMGYHAGGGPLGVIAAVALVIAFSVALSWAWTALGLVLRTPNAVMSLGFVLLFPLTFLSNIFVEPDTMPAALRAFAVANPISHLVTATRGLMEGDAETGELLHVMIAATLLTLVFAPLTTWLYRRRT